MVRLDSTAIEKGLKSVMTIEGCKAVSLIPSGSPYSCLKSEEVKVCTNTTVNACTTFYYFL